MSLQYAIVVGDPTEVGGEAMTGMTDHRIQCLDGNYSFLVCIGDSVLCGQCGMTTVAEGYRGFFTNRPAAYHGCKLACGHRMVATRQRLLRFEVAATGKTFLPASTASFDSSAPGRFTEQYRAVDEQTGAALQGVPYLIELADGRSFTGKTDKEGLTVQVSSHAPEQVQLSWLMVHCDADPVGEEPMEKC